MFGGITIHTVEPGVEVEHEGEKLTVTEEQAVHKGRHIYMTARQVAALKAHPEVKTAPRTAGEGEQ